MQVVAWVIFFCDRLDNPYETATFLHERTSELLRLLSVKDVPMEQIVAFLAKFIRENRFRQVEFDDMNREFIQEFGVDWWDSFAKMVRES